MKIPLAKHFYQLDSLPESAQECVNLFFEETISETKTEGVLYGTPGLKLFATIGSDPIYGMYQMNDLLYAVSGNNVYTIDQFGGSTNLGSMGTVTDTVIMADNDTHVVIVLESGAAYLATPTTLVQITDGDFQNSSSVTVLDYFGIFPKTGTSQYYISDLNDLTSYNPLKFSSAESTTDNIVRAFAFNDEIWLFKQSATEVHYNTGDGDFPFTARQNATLQRGCAAKRSVAQEDNTIFWLGEDRIFYRADGYRPKRISTYAIEQQIQKYTTISDAESFVYTQNGHKFYITTFPTELVTWVHDISTGLWHRRESFEKGRWLAASHTIAYGKNLVGDFETGKIYELDMNTYTDNGLLIQRTNTLPPLFENGNRSTLASLKVDFDAGVGLSSGQGEDPQVALSISRDGGYTFGNEMFRSIGKIGKYLRRAVWRRLGQGRQIVPKLVITDPVRVAITGAYINEPD